MSGRCLMVSYEAEHAVAVVGVSGEYWASKVGVPLIEVYAVLHPGKTCVVFDGWEELPERSVLFDAVEAGADVSGYETVVRFVPYSAAASDGFPACEHTVVVTSGSGIDIQRCAYLFSRERFAGATILVHPPADSVGFDWKGTFPQAGRIMLVAQASAVQ